MLSGQHFYYRTIRRNVVAFGTMFKDIQLVTYSNDSLRNELKRVTVPLMYGDKEDYYLRLKQAGAMPVPTDLPLPRMQFKMTNIRYDSSRKQQSQLQQWAQAGVSPAIAAQYVPVPYNISFELQAYVRNTEDGLQIIEQILPYFTPEYTLSMVFVDQSGLTKNVPITLDGVDRMLENEGATDWTMRREVWTLNFTMQTYLFGPMAQAGLITQTNTNIWQYSTSGVPVQLSLAGPGFLAYQVGETVYQGGSLQTANARATVQAFYAKGNTLVLNVQDGNFVANANVIGVNSSASWNVANVPVVDPLVTIIDTPVPANANVDQDFGFTVTITETPKTLNQ